MILIHPLKIAFCDVPKVGSTSLFSWLHEIVFGRPYERLKGMPHIHQWFGRQQTDLISNTPNTAEAIPSGYFSFCLTRDPVKRFLSAYGNRVHHYKELALVHADGRKAVQLGLRSDPEVNYLVEHLTEYQRLSAPILHHTRPMTDFLGTTPSVYQRLFDVSEMPKLRQVLLNHWQGSGIALDTAAIPEIPRLQTGGPKLGLDVLTANSLEKLLDYYKTDYDTFPTVDRESTIKAWESAWQQASNDRALAKEQVLIVKQGRPSCIEKSWLLRVPELVQEGNVTRVQFAGIVLLKADCESRPDLVFEDAWGGGILQWQPSPHVATQHPENAHANKARFIATSLAIAQNRPVHVFLQHPGGMRELLLKVSSRANA